MSQYSGPLVLIAKLEPITAVPVLEMRDSLSIFKNLKGPHAWTGRFRGSPSKWTNNDGDAVANVISAAISNPVERPFDPAKLAMVPPILRTSAGTSVVIPEDEESLPLEQPPIRERVESSEELVTEFRAHTEIQWLLLKLGSDMGLDVWVARNDRSQSYRGQTFQSLPRLLQKLPVQFDDATNRTIELIDVLWLRGNAIEAAFEIESTTSIFSGLLRMADLITMQPNINIPLYIVAPSERRNKVIAEVNRPTFARLSPSMSEMCRFISFEELKKELAAAQYLVQFLKPEFVESFSESCVIGD